MNFYNLHEPISSVNSYSNTLYKLRCNKINLYFNKTCKRKNVIPKYINIRINATSESALRAKLKAEKMWLSNEIKFLYTKINNLTMKVYSLQLQISKEYHYLEYLEIMQNIDEKVDDRLKLKRRTIRDKLKSLLTIRSQNNEGRPKTSNKFYQRVENRTNIQLNNNEMELLEKGLKYNIFPKNNANNQNKHLMAVENAITNTKIEHQSDIRVLVVDKIKDVIQNVSTSREETKIVKKIKNKINNANAIITKADKGNTVVIMDRNEYHTKMLDFINNNNIEELAGDPTPNYSRNIKDILNKCTHFMNQKEIRCNKMIKPLPPKIRGLPKIHKPDVPIRPIVNFTTAPTYKIAKHINKWLQNNLKLVNDRSIKNNIELINKIESIKIPPNAKLASFDVTNMYSNIPVKETIEITKQSLIRSGKDEAIVEEVIKLLEEITKQNYFSYGNKFYIQYDGLPMGSPLSGTLANIYLNHFENSFVMNENNQFYRYIKYWHRYVDDIFLMFTGTNRQMDQLLMYMNKKHKNIKFTLEKEQGKKINFLDLTIENKNQNHIFKIYRKPTQTDQTIDHNSNHPFQHKIAAYNHMIHRLNSVPMTKKDYSEELNTIKYIASMNGFQHNMVDKMNSVYINKQRYKQNTTLDNANSTEENYISVEYNKNTSQHLQRIFRHFGYKIAYKTVNKLGQYLKEREISNVETGVYKLKCSDCPSFYIGQTGRSFSQRFKEHTREIGRITPESRFAVHINNTQHNYENMATNLEVLYRIQKCEMLNRIEEFEIYKNRHSQFLLNNKINTSTNAIYDLILRNNT